METLEERFPFLFNTQADYNTNSQSYYDGLAKYNKVLQILAKMIEEYDVKLDNSLENINTVLTNYTTMLDGKLAGFDDSVMLLLREWIDDGTFEMIINTEIFNHKLDTVIFNDYKENADNVALSFSQQLEHIKYKRVNVKDYGAVGDGVTDDSGSFRAAIAALDKNGSILDIPYGVYLHGDGITSTLNYTGYKSSSGGWSPNPTSDVNLGPDNRFLFDGFKNLIIHGNNASIVSNEANGETRNNSIFTFINCDNLKVYDLDVDGNIETRIPEFNDRDDGGGHLIRGNIYLQNCIDVYFKNVKSHHSMLDGIFAFKTALGTSYNHVYEDCDCFYNYRQGLTLSSIDNVKVVRGEYSYNGTIYGTLPKSGIDIEADASNAKNIVISGTVFKGNASNNLVLSFRSTGIVIDECQFYDGSVLLESSLNKGNIIKNCKFYNTILTVSQEEVDIIDNEFTYDRQLMYFEIDWYNVPDNGGGYSNFSRNKIKCVLPATIDSTQKLYYGACRIDNAKLKILDNEFVDVFATKYEPSIYDTLRLIGYEIKDNRFKFTKTFDTVNTRFNIHSAILENNKISGYTEKEKVSKDIVSGYKLTKRFNLSVVSGTPIVFEVIGAMFFKLTTYDSPNTHYEEKLFVYNSGGGQILGSQVLLTINPSTVRAYATTAAYDFTNGVLTCTVTPSFTGTLYIDFDSNAPTRVINTNSVVKR